MREIRQERSGTNGQGPGWVDESVVGSLGDTTHRRIERGRWNDYTLPRRHRVSTAVYQCTSWRLNFQWPWRERSYKTPSC